MIIIIVMMKCVMNDKDVTAKEEHSIYMWQITKYKQYKYDKQPNIKGIRAAIANTWYIMSQATN